MYCFVSDLIRHMYSKDIKAFISPCYKFSLYSSVYCPDGSGILSPFLQVKFAATLNCIRKLIKSNFILKKPPAMSLRM